MVDNNVALQALQALQLATLQHYKLMALQLVALQEL
jgi:hypothetical protein